MTPKCPACGSESISGETRGPMPRGGAIELKDPNAVFVETEYAALTRARICHSCGYVMLFVDKSIAEQLRKGELVPKTGD